MTQSQRCARYIHAVSLLSCPLRMVGILLFPMMTVACFYKSKQEFICDALHKAMLLVMYM